MSGLLTNIATGYRHAKMPCAMQRSWLLPNIYDTCGATEQSRLQNVLNFCTRVINGRDRRNRPCLPHDLKWINASKLILYCRICNVRHNVWTGHPNDIARAFVRAVVLVMKLKTSIDFDYQEYAPKLARGSWFTAA